MLGSDPSQPWTSPAQTVPWRCACGPASGPLSMRRACGPCPARQGLDKIAVHKRYLCRPPHAHKVVWRREAALQSDRGFITPAVRPAVAGALWVPVQDKYRLETQLPHISHQSALHGSQPCPPTNTLTSLEPTKLPQGSASSSSCPSRPSATLSRSRAFARAAKLSSAFTLIRRCYLFPESCSMGISLNPESLIPSDSWIRALMHPRGRSRAIARAIC